MKMTDLLSLAVAQGASDLHISAGMPPLLRVDGEIRAIDGADGAALSPTKAHTLISEIMTESQRQDYATNLDLDFALSLPTKGSANGSGSTPADGSARFRVNAFVQQRGAAAVFRVIPGEIPPMDDLGMGSVFQDIAAARQGLVLVTGPTGCGKSTTLAALLQHINRSRRSHILTIEDPIEFIHPNEHCLISQREVHRHSRTFASALRAALREDPDIILIGELRDLESIRLALSAAETGHLVLATLHTASAAKTVDRVIDVFPAAEKAMVRAMLAESIHAVVSQALLKRKGGGRLAAHEIMLTTPAVRNLIRENKLAQLASVMQTGGASGMQTMAQCLQSLQAQGLVAEEAVTG